MDRQDNVRGICRGAGLALMLAAVLMAAAPVGAQATEQDECDGPQNVRAHTEGDTIVVRWDAYPNATGYVVHRGEGSERATFLVELEGDTTTYTDAEVEVGTTYTYQATALYPFGERQFESQPCGEAQVTAIPSFPTLAGGVLAGIAGVAAYGSLRRRTG